MNIKSIQTNKKELTRCLISACVISCALFGFAACDRLTDTDHVSAPPTDDAPSIEVSPSPFISDEPVSDAPSSEAVSESDDPSFTPASATPDVTDPTDAPESTSSYPTEQISATPEPTPSITISPVSPWIEAKYLGVEGYGSVDADDLLHSNDAVYKFLIDGKIKLYSVQRDADLSIFNNLMEGYNYRILVKNGIVTASACLDMPSSISSKHVKSKPGVCTLKNFLATAMQPLGTTLYVYGGGWNWQDDGASNQARSIGVSGTWVDFFNQQNADYLYKDDAHKSSSYYPFGGWNEYYYAGLDCSGFIGWAVYNTLNNSSGHKGYVYSSTAMANTFAQKHGLGSFIPSPNPNGSELLPGDIVSIKGHVYIVIGRCADESIVILHSTPSTSVTGKKGGGVQLSAIDPHDRGKACMAYALCSSYQEKYFPEWSARYPAEVRPFSTYFDISSSVQTGVFRWSRSETGLFDPDGYAYMSADAVLADLFNEN